MSSSNKNFSPSHFWIIILVQAVIYLSIWLWDEYVASYITLIFPALILVVLLLTVIADLIEPSRIPGWYYILMVVSIVIPILIGAVFYFINEGRIGWIGQL